MTRRINLDLIKASAAQAGLSFCTEVYGAAMPNTSIAEARSAASYRVMLCEAAVKLGSPLVAMTGRPRRDGGLENTIAGYLALLPLIEHLPLKLALEPHYGS